MKSALPKKCPNADFFRPLFSHISNEHENFRANNVFSLNKKQQGPGKTPQFEIFHAVVIQKTDMGALSYESSSLPIC